MIYEHMIDFVIKIQLKVFTIYAHVLKNIVLSKWMIYWMWLYMVLAQSDLVYKIVPSTRIWELHAMPLWQEPPLESQFYDIRERYESCVLHLCGESHLQSLYPVILTFWRHVIVIQMPLGLLMVLLAFGPVISISTWILPCYDMDVCIDLINDSKLEPNYMRLDLFYISYSLICYYTTVIH